MHRRLAAADEDLREVHGALGVSEDSFLSKAYAGARALSLADGPDEVHLTALAKSMVGAR